MDEQVIRSTHTQQIICNSKEELAEVILRLSPNTQITVSSQEGDHFVIGLSWVTETVPESQAPLGTLGTDEIPPL